MWIFRELSRLVGRITVAVLLAIVFAEARALIAGGDTMHTFRWVILGLGGIFLLLGGHGNRERGKSRCELGRDHTGSRRNRLPRFPA
jgi:hypothetical protein